MFPASIFPASIFPSPLFPGADKGSGSATPTDLGRFQRGQRITLTVQPGSKTDILPVATILDPSGQVFASFSVPYVSPAGSPSPTYSSSLRLPGGSSLGTYQVSFSFSVSGQAGSDYASFEAVPGGDSGGEVISLFSYSRPEASYVLAQLATGKLVQGRNPHL